MHKASMSRRATDLALMSRDFSAVRATRTTEAGCQPGETLASAGRGVFVLSTTAYLSTQGELHLGGQRRSLTGRRIPIRDRDFPQVVVASQIAKTNSEE